MEWLNVIHNAARVFIFVGGAVFAIAVCVSGFYYMTAFGDPQKQNTARGALVGAFVGMCIMGISFAAPRVMSQFVLQPAGLGTVDRHDNSCDGALRSALVTHRNIARSSTAQAVIREIQAQRSDCPRNVWNPEVAAGWGPGGTCMSSAELSAQLDRSSTIRATGDVLGGSGVMIGDTEMPYSLAESFISRSDGYLGVDEVGNGIIRDAFGNILVWFYPHGLPTNGSQCWIYISSTGHWDYRYGVTVVSATPTVP